MIAALYVQTNGIYFGRPDGERRPRVGKRAASATPPEFFDALIAIASQAQGRNAA